MRAVAVSAALEAWEVTETPPPRASTPFSRASGSTGTGGPAASITPLSPRLRWGALRARRATNPASARGTPKPINRSGDERARSPGVQPPLGGAAALAAAAAVRRRGQARGPRGGAAGGQGPVCDHSVGPAVFRRLAGCPLALPPGYRRMREEGEGLGDPQRVGGGRGSHSTITEVAMRWWTILTAAGGFTGSTPGCPASGTERSEKTRILRFDPP